MDRGVKERLPAMWHQSFSFIRPYSGKCSEIRQSSALRYMMAFYFIEKPLHRSITIQNATASTSSHALSANSQD
jgi:hypothetical protein